MKKIMRKSLSRAMATAVVTTIAGDDDWRLAQEIGLRLTAADPANGTITFQPA